MAAWRRFHDIATGVGATNVTWVWCPNTEFPGSTPLGQLYPGDAYVDWTCVDVYNKGGSRWQSFSDLFTPTYQQLLRIAPSRPMMIAETSSVEEGGSKAEWITSLLARDLPLRFPRVKAVVWFNWRINEDGASWGWPIETSASAEAAFAAGIAAPYYAAAGAFQIPARGFKILPLDD